MNLCPSECSTSAWPATRLGTSTSPICRTPGSCCPWRSFKVTSAHFSACREGLEKLGLRGQVGKCLFV